MGSEVTLGFVVFILGGGNPANFWSEVIVGEIRTLPSWWRLKIAAAVLAMDIYVQFQDLATWAAVETLSAGSHQRIKCPIYLIGSGRWGAMDGGGHYKLLREQVVGYSDLDAKFRRNFERLAIQLAGSGHWPTPEMLEKLATRVAEAAYGQAVEEYRHFKAEISPLLDNVGLCLDERECVHIEQSEYEDLSEEELAAYKAATQEQLAPVVKALRDIDRWSPRRH
jgi:hypothetical protein